MDTVPDVSLPTVSFIPNFIPGGDVFQILLYVSLVLYVIYTVILFYHWFTYTSDRKVATVTCVAYLAVTIPMILTLITTTVIIT